MTDAVQLNLNEGQQAAADGFFQFLLSDDKELIISGPGGVGKTFLMGHLIDKVMPNYHEACALMGIAAKYHEVVMTATTNKAAEVLAIATNRPTETIHSLMNLTVKDDYRTGKSILSKTNNWRVHQNKIIFIDESSMIDQNLLNLIREGTHNCKIIFVGDHCQLAPIMEPISPVYKTAMPFFELTQPMRNNGQPALMALCDQLRETVKTGVFNPIHLTPGVVDLLDGSAMEADIRQHFLQDTHSRILAYTNQRVVDYNNHVRGLRQITSPYIVGEKLINNSAIQMRDGMLSVEEEVEIIRLDDTITEIEIAPDIHMQVQYGDLQTKFGDVYAGMPLPVDRDHYTKLVKYYASNKVWERYFHLKKTYPDLRPRDAATVHKAQGSTYDTVFVDLGDLSTCRDPNVAARLLYVAFTRAKNRVVLYGNLVEKFGGVVT